MNKILTLVLIMLSFFSKGSAQYNQLAKDFTFNNVEVPYMFVYVPSQERVLASFFSDQYLNEGIIRDIQLILLKAGFDVGYPEGKFNQKFNDAIALAVKNNLISKSDVNNGYEKILIKLMTNNYCKEAYGHCVKTM